MLTDSHCLTTEHAVCLINTHKHSTNGMEIAMAFRAVEREREQIDSVTYSTEPSCGTASVFSCHRRMAVIRETVLPRLQSSISQPRKWYAHHLCYGWHGNPLCITCVRPDKGMIEEMESHQTPAIPEGWEGGIAVSKGTCCCHPSI